MRVNDSRALVPGQTLANGYRVLGRGRGCCAWLLGTGTGPVLGMVLGLVLGLVLGMVLA